jgi:hypothetical protein
VLENIRNPEILDDIELSIIKAYLKSMKAIRNYLVLCLLLVIPLQSIAASFQLACQNNHKTSVTAETKMSHCHQTKEHKQSKEVKSHNFSSLFIILCPSWYGGINSRYCYRIFSR